MKWRNAMGRGLLLASLLAGSALGAQKVSSPSSLRGVWFHDSQLGQHQCLQYRLRRTGELVPGTLVIADSQIAEARAGVQEDVLFLTEVTKLDDEAWQVMGLLDVYPYQKIKEIRAYGFSLQGSKLYRSSTEIRDGRERMHTQSYVRCI